MFFFQTGALEKPTVGLATPRTSQLRERVARGEAHRSALAMTEGRFDGPPEATIELSNLGRMWVWKRFWNLAKFLTFAEFVGRRLG